MAEPESPLDVFVAWYSGLPPELGKDLLSAIAIMCPRGFLPSLEDSSQLGPKLQAHAPADHAAAGMVLTLVALTDFVFLDRGSSESWQRHEAMLDLVQQAHEAGLAGEVDDAMMAFLEESRMRQPFRAKMWMKEHANWLRLRSGPLSTESVQRWLKAKMLGGV